MLKANSKSVAGLDGIAMDVYKLSMRTVTKFAFAIFLKSQRFLTEAIQHKCGLLVSLFKHKGAHSDMNAYRSIMISDPFGR